MTSDQVVARGVEQDGEAPGISEGNEVGFAGKVLDVEDFEQGNLFAGHLRLIYAFAKRARKH